MRFLLSILLLCLAIPAQAAYNRDIQLEAIRLVENTPGRGKHGELGPWQLTKGVRARVGGHDKAAAMRWLIIVEGDMKRYHIAINPYNVGLVWNGGINAVRRGKIADSTCDYALRVSNLAETLYERTKPVPKPVRFSLQPQHRFAIP